VGVTRVAVIPTLPCRRSVTASAAIGAFWMTVPANDSEALSANLFGWIFCPHLSERHHSTLTLTPHDNDVQGRKVGQGCHEVGQT